VIRESQRMCGVKRAASRKKAELCNVLYTMSYSVVIAAGSHCPSLK